MIKLSFPANDKEAAKVFGKALLAYSGETVIATTANEVLVDLNATVAEGVEALTLDTTAEETSETAIIAETGSLTESMDQTADAKVDPKGVVFDEKYCGNATEPFYQTGAMKDQWKKKRGVTDAVYNAWYFDQLTQQGAETPANTTEQAETNINVGAAFGQAAETSLETAAVECPEDAGKFMVWVSELQAAGRISEEQLKAAYAEINIPNAFVLFQEGGYSGVQAVFPVICRMAGL